MQLKRDSICDRCGCLTKRERVKWISNAIYVGVLILIVLIFNEYVREVIGGLSL